MAESGPALTWHLLTGEYPPAPGGVSDYTRLVARGLAAAGDKVEVWAPACAGAAPSDPGVRVNWLPGNYGPAALYELERGLRSRPFPRRLLVQYVPHAYGYKAMNVGLVHWLCQARRRERVWVMFHEVCILLGRGQPLKHRFLATVQRWMARQVGRAAHRRFVSTPFWKTMLHSLGLQTGSTEWLPVPSTVPTYLDVQARDELRTRLLPTGGQILGHFGTFSAHLTALLQAPLVDAIRRDCRRIALLIGRGGESYAARLGRENPDLAGRIHGTGELGAVALALHLAACDLLLQPYAEGLTARRTSLMASAALGLPIVSSRGPLTEPIWDTYQAVCLVDNSPAAWTEAVERLLSDTNVRATLGRQARRLYQDCFAVERTVAILRERHRQDMQEEERQ